ncbi:NADH-ubiquinone oxidoreductase-F iron-sulfur binding region domain-containing protein [Planomonospora parontospora]|uniref:NADH-ubiquinone oxidoreductase-F iron-sulfur binding region domain-containing protein n=1 Tax=Planomonospora parontospora TaxID=58119 RepID=UPI00166FF608|nr:NADH-ubiquinone oxidoreductase-F iron-sulfur binding region domain-containing protein [Planomonospora parontospora]GGL58036.1 NADH dehydrogenase [Planomonospora parontospora subsp. antibiotica]GII19896.1 NADH dehydrogenase [Planomonospora parontospora subsp. antibiotica]
MDLADRFDAFRALADRRGRPGVRLIASLADAAAASPARPQAWAPAVAAQRGLPAAAGLGPATFYADLAAGRGRRHVRVCTAAACFAARLGGHLPEVEQALGVTAGAVRADGEVSLQAVRCLGYCYAGPACLDGDAPRTGPDVADQLSGRAAPRAPQIPAADATGDPVVLAGITGACGPWRVWPETVATRTPEQVRAEVAASGLRGRGGAGFPVAAKWAAAGRSPDTSPDTVVIANGDEGDPGSYADRLLMEADPARVLEGLALACFACQARRGVVLVRSEYPRALERMRAALQDAYADGHLGRAVHGSGAEVDVEVVEGAGSYVAGEETALIAGLEGGRGCARPRPPYPTREGLWGAPTVVNNVETLAAVPWIVRRGGPAYARRGSSEETGTKLVCLSERFARPGCYEVELGTPVLRIVTELGGGPKEGTEFDVVQVGGPLGGFLAADRLDVPLTEAALARCGAALGHAGLVAFDRRARPEEVLRHVWEFAAAESCGACSPCRVGSRRGLEIVRAAGSGGPDDDDAAEYARLLRVMGEASLCAFGRRVPAAVRSLVRAYGDRLAGWDR